MKKIVVCGGHVTPALAVIDELPRDIKVIFIGRKYALEGSVHPSAEYRLVQEKGITFLPLTTGRLQRKFTFYTIPSLLKFPVGICQAFWYLLRERPRVILSFGGYIALPVAIAGWILSIPIVTHEQTLTVGLANRIIEKLAKRVCVAFPGVRGEYTGLPMRRVLFKKQPSPFAVVKGKPLLYITGGSTGAQSLNEFIYPLVPRLTKTYMVIHQTGKTSVTPPVYNGYISREFLSVGELSWVLSRADIVIGRSGANTTLELAALANVAILVPLPWSAANEQLLQARWLAAHGGAVILEQSALTPGSFFTRIADVQKNYAILKHKAEGLSREIPRDGAKKLFEVVNSYLS